MANVIRNRRLTRRTFLRGVGASLALPLLDAMVPAIAQVAPGGPGAGPLRSVFVFAPNGMSMDAWTPAAVGRGAALSRTLAPLAPVKERVRVLSGLALDGGRAHGDGPGDHARAAASYLTTAHPVKTGGADIRAGVSIDQAIAGQIGGATRFPSLELGHEAGRRAGACDSGYSCAYSNNISWKSPTTPVAKEVLPREVFARLFGDPDELAGGGEKRRLRDRRSVLDVVLGDVRQLQGRLGSGDRVKLDEYLTSVRELEKRLEHEENSGPEIEVPGQILEGGGGFRERAALMYDLIALAFEADLTRTVTLMLGNAGSNRSYRFLDVPEGHHELSHHGGNKEKVEKIARIDRFHVEVFAGFLQRLQRTPEGDGSLLDRSMIVYGSGLADGNRHAHEDLPILVAGGGFNTGGHWKAQTPTPLANLYLTMLHKQGIEAESFGDSSGTLAL